MRHFMVTMVAGLILAQAAFGQDSKQPKDSKDGQKPAFKPPLPSLVPPGVGKTIPVLPGRPPGPFAHLNGKTVIFAVNGVADATTLYDHLQAAIVDTGAPMVALHVKWSRYHEVLKDYRDQEGQKAAGYRLAATVLAIRKDAPAARIIFMGHGAGTCVVLAAAEMLPPASIDRIFLFASAVSSGYYLKPALCASRGGIDAFASRDDGMLEFVEECIGSADGRPGRTAGRVGFVVPRMPLYLGPAKEKKVNPDVPLYANLRQVCWTEELAGAGEGGHWSFIRESFLRNQILPQLLSVGEGAVNYYSKR